MTNDQVAAALQFGTSQGTNASTVWVVQVGQNPDGSPAYKQISNIDFLPFKASLAPAQVPADAAIVVISLA